MVKKTTRRKRIVEPEVMEVKNVCSICHGRGFTEHGRGGLEQRKCVCGTVSIGERIGVIAQGAGQVIGDSGGEDTIQSEVTKEPEADEGVQVEDGDIFSES